MFDPVAMILLIPIAAAAVLALLPGYVLTARLNVLAAGLTMLAAFSLLVVDRPAPGPYLFVDDLNIVFITLSTFVAFTTSVFRTRSLLLSTLSRFGGRTARCVLTVASRSASPTRSRARHAAYGSAPPVGSSSR